MSNELLTRIWNSGLPVSGSKLLVLLALADQANDGGECWPSVKTIARRSRVSERTVQRITQEFAVRGWLTITPRQTEEGGSSSNLYRIILPDTARQQASARGCHNANTRGVSQCEHQGGDTIVTPKPSLEPSSGPSSSETKKQFQKTPRVTLALAEPAEAEKPEERTPAPPRDVQNALRSTVREHFCRRTGLKAPNGGDTAARRRELGRLWWTPIREICELAGWDERRALKLVDDALNELDGLVVSDPNSILKTCRALAARKGKEDRAWEAELERIRRREQYDRMRFGAKKEQSHAAK